MNEYPYIFATSLFFTIAEYIPRLVAQLKQQEPYLKNRAKMRLVSIKIICISITILVLTNCDNSSNSKPADKADPVETISSDSSKPIAKESTVAAIHSDSVEITTLTRNMYKWYETKSSKGEFHPRTNSPGDSVYAGIDWKAHESRMKEFAKTKLFAKDFLDNYQKIASYIDKELKQGTTEWMVDDMSPFEADANAWCNCQDNPENYWEKLTLTSLKKQSEYVAFKWTWGDDFYYSAKAKKEGGVWKIAYLEGFDYKIYQVTDN